jgi:hypothetical protein
MKWRRAQGAGRKEKAFTLRLEPCALSLMLNALFSILPL